MKQLLLVGNLFWFIGCHEPCKNGYGRAADSLCYPLADEPVAPCGEGYARDDDGDCVAVATASGGDSTGGGAGAGGTGGSTGSGGTGGTETGPSDASGGDESGAASAGGSAPGSADGGSSTGVVDGFDSASIKGVLNTTDASGFSEGDEVLIQVWTGDMIDPITGWPLESSMDTPRESHVAGAAVPAISIHFEFTLSDVPESGEEVRITGHLTDDMIDWEDAPQGAYPADPEAWLLVTPGMTTEGLVLLIDNGGEGGEIPPAPDGGTSDLGPLDGGMPDGGTPDLGPADGGPPDGGTPDGGTPDLGPPDGGPPDTGAPDADL